MRGLPFGRGGVGRHVPHAKAANITADLLRVDDRLVPRLIIGHRAFDGKLPGVAIDDD